MFVRYLLSHLVVGCVAGLVATAGLIATDVGSLGDLMQHSKDGWLAAALLAVGFVRDLWVGGDRLRDHSNGER